MTYFVDSRNELATKSHSEHVNPSSTPEVKVEVPKPSAEKEKDASSQGLKASEVDLPKEPRVSKNQQKPKETGKEREARQDREQAPRKTGGQGRPALRNTDKKQKAQEGSSEVAPLSINLQNVRD